jgi:4'-phosphopantetheinyl transferase EntD
MSRETSALLKSILIHLETAKTLEDAKELVQAICTKEEIAEVEQAITRIGKANASDNAK